MKSKTNNIFSQLKKKIITKKAKIIIVGMGYVGFALAEAVITSYDNFVGFDIDKRRIKEIRSKNKKLRVSINIQEIKNSDVIIVCLPTPVKNYVQPDLECIDNALNRLIKHVFKEGQLLIIESTVQPGTTRDYISKLITNKKKKFKIGENFFIGYSPERVDPGSEKFSDIRKIPKIVSGLTSNCLALTETFYEAFIEKLHKVSSPEVAELAKLYENTFRAVNIAFVEEIARITNRLGMNILEVLDAAYTKPFGILPFYPSVGVGGHCIPVDLLYLDSWARTNDCYSQFVELSHRTNQGMPYYVMQRIVKILNTNSISLKGSKLLLLGVTYKSNVSDTRTSASLKLAKLLIDNGVDLYIHDPYVKNLELKCKVVKTLDKEIFKKSDLTIISVAHEKYKFDFIKKHSKKIFYCAGKPVPGLIKRSDKNAYSL